MATWPDHTTPYGAVSHCTAWYGIRPSRTALFRAVVVLRAVRDDVGEQRTEADQRQDDAQEEFSVGEHVGYPTKRCWPRFSNSSRRFMSSDFIAAASVFVCKRIRSCSHDSPGRASLAISA